MKVTTRYYPILTGARVELDEASFAHIQQSEFSADYHKAWNILSNTQKYRVVSMTIFNHLSENSNLMDQLSKLAPEAKIEACWYLMGNTHQHQTIGVARCNDSMAFVVVATGTKGFTAGGVFLEEDEDMVSYDMNLVDPGFGDVAGAFGLFFGTIIPTFVEFAETQIITLNSAFPGRRKAYLDEKYVTDSKVDVEIIDSTWYRELIHIGDFGVSGHFRLQPYGPMNSMRKLIYVKDFVKHGYRRAAKKDRLAET